MVLLYILTVEDSLSNEAICLTDAASLPNSSVLVHKLLAFGSYIHMVFMVKFAKIMVEV